jgi:AraC family transcriptional regulator
MARAPMPVTLGVSESRSLEVDGLRVTDSAFPALLTLAPHEHERACVSVILEGSFTETFGGHSYACPASSVLTKPPGERHHDRFDRVGARNLIIEPANPLWEQLGRSARLFEGIGHARDKGVGAIGWRVARELRDRDGVSPLAIEGLVLELLAMAARRSATPRNAGRAPSWLPRVRDLLHARFAEPVRLGDLAAEAGVHHAHLARVFRVHVGASVGTYVRRLRLEWAASQLAATELPLSEIALRAGFADQSHFTKAFKQHAGLTPLRYRLATRR